MAFSVTQEGTRIHIHLWDPWACVSVSTELHWVLRCKSDSCFQKGLCRSTRDLSLLVLLIFNPLSCSVPLHWIHRRNDRTDTGCMRKAAHGLQTFSLYLSHSFLCLFVYPWSFLSTLCLYKHLLNYICVCLHWEHSLIISGYILTPCTLRSLGMGVALKEGIFVAIQ